MGKSQGRSKGRKQKVGKVTRTVYTGASGGRFYMSGGKKVYLRKKD